MSFPQHVCRLGGRRSEDAPSSLDLAGGPRRGLGAGRGLSRPRRSGVPPTAPVRRRREPDPVSLERSRSRPPHRRSLPAKPAVRISPEAFTITADDPGLQLLAADEAEPARDRTAEVAVDGRAGGPGRDRAGGLSPADRAGGRDGQGRAAGGQRRAAGRGEGHDRAAVGPALGFRRGHRADPDPAGLQHGRLPRPAGGAERLPSLALRLRPGRRLPGRGARRRPAPAVAAGARARASSSSRRPGASRTSAGAGWRSAPPNIRPCWPGSATGPPSIAARSHGAVASVRVEPEGAVRLGEPGRGSSASSPNTPTATPRRDPAGARSS